MLGNWLSLAEVSGELGQEHWWMSAVVLVGLAVAGWLTSLMIMPLKAAGPNRTFSGPWDMAQQTVRDLQHPGSRSRAAPRRPGHHVLLDAGMLVQLNIDQFAFEGGAEADAGFAPAGRR